MNKIWPALLLCAIGFEVVSGNGGVVVGHLTACAGDALELMLSLLCAYMLWCGLIAVLESAGALSLLNRLMQPVLRRLFVRTSRENAPALHAVCANLSANMLGLGNAATAQGVRAVAQMHKKGGYYEEIGLFIVLNCSSVQLLPTTLITLRAKYGAPNPQDIWLEALLTTLLTTLLGVGLFRLWAMRRGNGHE
jgi:spore maturation protein A